MPTATIDADTTIEQLVERAEIISACFLAAAVRECGKYAATSCSPEAIAAYMHEAGHALQGAIQEREMARRRVERRIEDERRYGKGMTP